MLIIFFSVNHINTKSTMKLSFSLVLANSLAFAHGAAPSLRGAEKPRTLQVATPIKVPGECSLSNFISVLGTAEALQQTLGVSTEDELKAICEGALSTNTM